jgi:hypothetical protein
LMVKPIFKQHFFMVNSPQKNRWNHQQLRHYREAISYALYKRFPTARSLLVVWGPGLGPRHDLVDLKNRGCTRIFGGVFRGFPWISPQFFRSF